MRPLALLLALSLPAAAAPDPVQEAADWRNVLAAAVRSGGVKDAKACEECVPVLSDFPGCRGVDFQDLMKEEPKPEAASSAGACSADSCSVSLGGAQYDRIVERLRADAKCAASAADAEARRQQERDWGAAEVAKGLGQCGRCVTPADLKKWPERRRALMGLAQRLEEAVGRVDAASRGAALAPALAEARAEFVCSGGKVSPDACALKR